MLDWQAYLSFREQFREALDPRLYTIEHLDGLVWSGQARFWFNDDAAIIAKLTLFPSGAIVVEGLIAAGKLEAIKELIPLAEEWGRSCGAVFGMIESRPGWAREMKDYEPIQTRLLKEL